MTSSAHLPTSATMWWHDLIGRGGFHWKWNKRWDVVGIFVRYAQKNILKTSSVFMEIFWIVDMEVSIVACGGVMSDFCKWWKSNATFEERLGSKQHPKKSQSLSLSLSDSYDRAVSCTHGLAKPPPGIKLNIWWGDWCSEYWACYFLWNMGPRT